MKQSEIEAVAGAIVDTIKAAVDPLRSRIAALESRPTLKYVGTFQEGVSYDEASFATRSGALWLALRSTSQTPGQSPDWRLVVKSGGAV